MGDDEIDGSSVWQATRSSEREEVVPQVKARQGQCAPPLWVISKLRLLRISTLVVAAAISPKPDVSGQVSKGAVEVGVGVGPFLLMAVGSRETIGVIGGFGEPFVGYYVAGDLDIGASGFFYHSLDSDPSFPAVSFGGASLHVNYHFSSGSELSPFVGARLTVLTSESEPLFGFGTQIGLKYFVARQLSVNGLLTVLIFPTSEGVGLLSSLGVGISYHIH
jgi:hypothetical protein